MWILVLNCGSSSAKYKLYDVDKDRFPAEGAIERIGEETALLKHKGRGEAIKKRISITNHHEAIGTIIDILLHREHGVIASKDEITAIGHRVVHGGEEFNSSVLITEKVIASIKKYARLAPLHNPPALHGIRACTKLLSGIPQVAVFDTAFHQSLPIEAFMYAIPYKYYKNYGLRKYGFHGTSHQYVAGKAARLLKKDLRQLKLITCHLGNGCSMAAVYKGKSIETSMGFTPLEGLVMGTRSGDVDPAVVPFLMEKDKLTAHQIDTILNKKSGLLGVSGVSNDMRQLREARAKGDKRARLAIDMFVYRIKKYIGAYLGIMNGLDAIVLTAGIGENNPWLAERLTKELSEIVDKFKAKFLVVPTKEEWMIAMETCTIVKKRCVKHGKS
jgi:acetate kinase